MDDKSESSLQLPWVEKYRPSKLEDLVAQDDIVSILSNLIDSENLPHLLLYGPPGTGALNINATQILDSERLTQGTLTYFCFLRFSITGKTSTIVATAKRMYGSTSAYKSMTLELNASDARGIDVVREQIKEFAGTKQLFSKQGSVKLIILDEADAMTSDAQFALRRIIEKYTKSARFCLICNYVSKIIPALQSRCTRFRFAPLQREHIQGRLEYVANAENCNTTPDGIDAILRLSGGDMRRVLNLLQSTAMSFPVVNEKNVYLTSGAPLPCDIEKILDLLMNASFLNATKEINYMCNSKGYALADVSEQLTTKVVEIEMDSPALAMILDGMSNVEHRLAFGTDEKIQSASLVGVFIKTRELMTAKC
jgi:replication factor C subunit 3/5